MGWVQCYIMRDNYIADPFLLSTISTSFPFTSWCHFEVKDPIWDDDWPHSSFIRRSPGWGFAEFFTAVRQMPGDLCTVPGIISLGAFYKLRHTNFMIFSPPRPCHRWSHFRDPPPYLVWRPFFSILHLEIIKLKQHKIQDPSPPLVTQCHTSSTPSALLTCDVIYGCPLITLFISRHGWLTWHSGQQAIGLVHEQELVAPPQLA